MQFTLAFIALISASFALAIPFESNAATRLAARGLAHKIKGELHDLKEDIKCNLGSIKVCLIPFLFWMEADFFYVYRIMRSASEMLLNTTPIKSSTMLRETSTLGRPMSRLMLRNSSDAWITELKSLKLNLRCSRSS